MGTPGFEIERLVAESASRSAGDIPEKVMHKARDLFVDTIGCLFAGMSAEGISEVRQPDPSHDRGSRE